MAIRHCGKANGLGQTSHWGGCLGSAGLGIAEGQSDRGAHARNEEVSSAHHSREDATPVR